jgi:CrcB protein
MPLAMEFAFPLWENRLTVSVLMTPTSEPTTIGRIFMLEYVWVAIGGALGSVSRFWLSGVVASKFGETFPWGTLVINITGSFLIGFLAAMGAPEARWIITPRTKLFMMIGFCGGYTTFSSFSLQTLNLLRDREWLYAGGNILLSVILCMIGVWLGYLLGTTLNSRGA